MTHKEASIEPSITINGVRLSASQAMTLRVAASTFYATITDEGLGDDETGRAIAAGYKDRLREIFELMQAGEE